MSECPAEIAEFIRALPKAEIHIHLEGAIQPETVLTLAQRHNMVDRLPSTDLAALRQWFTFTDFEHFVTIFLVIQDMIRTADDMALIVYQNGVDMAAQNIRYRELTVTPYTHIDYQDKGMGIDDLLRGLDEGRQRAKREFGVDMRWVFDVPRDFSFPNRDGLNYDPTPAERTLAYALAGKDVGVVGFGLGGNEVGAPPAPFAHAFRQAKAAGLVSVPHAGETMGADSVRASLDDLGADRIGHGVRACEDPALLERLKAEQIPLEVNPTSNICLGIYPSLAEHPLRRLDDMGLFITVNSDDPPLFNTDLIKEYTLLITSFGYDAKGVSRLARNAFCAATLDEDIRAAMLAEFDEYLQNNPTS